MAQDRRGGSRTAALFLTNGAIFANLLPRYPEIKADLHLSTRSYRGGDRSVLRVARWCRLAAAR